MITHEIIRIILQEVICRNHLTNIKVRLSLKNIQTKIYRLRSKKLCQCKVLKTILERYFVDSP